MPQLDWDDTDVLASLEVIPTIGEYGNVYEYEVRQESLILRVAIWQYDSIVTVFLLHDEREIARWILVVRNQIRRVVDKASERLQFLDCVLVPSYSIYRDRQNPFDAALFPGELSMEISIKPHICVRFL